MVPACITLAGLIGQDFPNYSIVNVSKNGRTIGELLPITKNIDGEYALILLQIGGNDILQKRELTQVISELQEIISILSQHTDHLVMMSSGNIGGAAAFSGDTATEYEALTRSYRDALLQIANETELTYVDLFLEPADDIISDNPDVYLAVDGLHPSAAGYGVWYQILYPTLASILSKKAEN